MTTVHPLPRLEDLPNDRVLAPLAPLLESCPAPAEAGVGSHPNSGKRWIAFTKGAVDSIVDACDQVWDGKSRQALSSQWRERIDQGNESLASSGMRVLGVAYRILDHQVKDGDQSLEDHLVFIGMIGMIDPPREEVADAVARCRTAGIRPIMITGDHPLTAWNIAQQLHIAEQGRAITGRELEHLDAEALAETVRSNSVFARVAPKHKLELVRSLQQQGEVVAMTGDGVNDAPALKQAHIGVAMGITGTDVSKEASQMVLLDDNFATIVNAVDEGRIVYDNIRKFVKYTLTSNAGEIWVMLLGPLLGMPRPLLPLQILWVNLVTDGLPGLALAVEPPEKDTMQRPPFPPSEHIFGRGMGVDIAWIGLLMGVVSLAMGYWYWLGSASEELWRTLVFTVLTFSQLGNAMAIRSEKESLFSRGIFSNPMMVGSVVLTFALQLAVIYWAPLQNIFRTTALSAGELAACLLISTIVFWAVELHKRIRRAGG